MFYLVVHAWCVSLKPVRATGHRCRVFININNRSRISRQSKQRGCETPNALFSITMVEEGAAMKVIQIKTSPL